MPSSPHPSGLARRIYLARWVCLDVESNLARTGAEVAAAAAAGADVCVFPESFLHGYSRAADPARVRACFASASAAHPRLAIAFGSFSEDGRNRMTLWRAGSQIAAYDKVHLFLPNGEERLWDPGDRYVAVDLGGWVVGLINCNDLRFPEQARALRLEGRCDALLAVAWWPWRRDHVWSTLLRARAIENAVFTIGCCVSASEYPGENFSGAGNHVYDPLGEPVRTADDHLYVLDPARAASLVVDPLETYRRIDRVEVIRPG
jgi:omega-amidase